MAHWQCWRITVFFGFPRYQRTEDSYIYPYKLIRLNSKFIKFTVVKVIGPAITTHMSIT